MDDRLKTLYEIELAHLESHAAEFASRAPYREIAERLGIGAGAQLRDPFVDWLLDGSAFMAARIQHTIDAEFPRFSGAMLDILYPHLGAPVPSMLIAQFGFTEAGAAALAGPVAPKGLELGLSTAPGPGDRPREAVFVTGRSVALWPARVAEARVLTTGPEVAQASGGQDAPSGLEVVLELTAPGAFRDCDLDHMDLHFAGDMASRLMRAIAFEGARVGVASGRGARRGASDFMPVAVTPLGFDAEVPGPDGAPERDALLPYDRRSFDGYRLIHEFFALPARFRFVRLSGLRAALESVEGTELRLVFLFGRDHPDLAGRVGADALRLNCVPAVNLFRKRADNIDLDIRRAEHHVVADRARPTDFEIHTVERVTGFSEDGTETRYRPFFSSEALGAAPHGKERYFVAARRPRAAPVTLAGEGAMAAARYRGSETFISLVDETCAPFPADLKSLRIDALCTNRHLALRLPSGARRLSMRKDFGADFAVVVDRPSRPREGAAVGRRQWDAVSHLTLNHLSMMETESGDSAEALRQMLGLYADMRKTPLIAGLERVEARETTGRAPVGAGPDGRPTPVAVTRGVEVALAFDAEVEAADAAALCAVLERFFAGYATAGTFTRTVLKDSLGEEAIRWPKRTGLREML